MCVCIRVCACVHIMCVCVVWCNLCEVLAKVVYIYTVNTNSLTDRQSECGGST